MPTYNERLASQKNLLSIKLKRLEEFNKSLETARENIKKVNKEISDIKAKIIDIETHLLAEAIAEKGYSVADFTAAIEKGTLAEFLENCATYSTSSRSVENENCATYSTSSHLEDNENCATYSTNNNENLPEKEGLDDISGSGETVGGA